MGCIKSKPDDHESLTRERTPSSRHGENGAPPVAQYGSTGNSRPSGYSVEAPPERGSTPLTISARPLGQFVFLKKSYSINTPSCLIPRINELFKSICDRYDVAVVNREKVDEALKLFRQVLGVAENTSMEASFAAWKACLTNPKFTISFKPGTGDVKDVRMRATDIPKDKRRALKCIRDMIDACHLFLQQKEFLQRQIGADLVQLDSLSGQLQNLGKDCGLSNSEKKQLPRTYSMAREQFGEFSDILDMFFAQVFSLLNEVNASVHVLEARESSTER